MRIERREVGGWKTLGHPCGATPVGVQLFFKSSKNCVNWEKSCQITPSEAELGILKLMKKVLCTPGGFCVGTVTGVLETWL